jgi:hypothetical protein
MEEPQYIKLKMTFYGLDLHDHAMLFSLFKTVDPSIKKKCDIYIDEPKKTCKEVWRLLKQERKLS